jgi:hypothetical protein
MIEGTEDRPQILHKLRSVSKQAYDIITTTTTLDSTYKYVKATVGGITVNLPTASGIAGRIYSIDNAATTDITVDAYGSETIEGELTQIVSPDCCMVIVSDGTNWRIT